MTTPCTTCRHYSSHGNAGVCALSCSDAETERNAMPRHPQDKRAVVKCGPSGRKLGACAVSAYSRKHIEASQANFGWESPEIVAKRKAGIATAHHRKWMPARFIAGDSLEAIAAHYRVPVSQVAVRIGEYADREYARFFK